MCDRKWERMACFLLSREDCISYQILPIAVLGGVPRKDKREWLGILGRGVSSCPHEVIPIMTLDSAQETAQNGLQTA